MLYTKMAQTERGEFNLLI